MGKAGDSYTVLPSLRSDSFSTLSWGYCTPPPHQHTPRQIYNNNEGTTMSLARVIERLQKNEEDFTRVSMYRPLSPDQMRAISSALMDRNSHVEAMYLDNCFRYDPSLRGDDRSSYVDSVDAFLTSILGRSHPSLEVFSVTSNGDVIDDQRAKVVAATMRSNTSLKQLRLDLNNIGPEGAAALVETLKDLTSLEQFNLAANPIGDEGVKAIAAAMRVNTSITGLSLLRCGFTDEGCNDLVKMLFANPRLLYATFLVDTDLLPGTRMKRTLRQLTENRDCYLDIRSNMSRIPLALWPKALKQVASLPDCLFHILKAKPNLCRNPGNTRRKRRH